MNIRIFWVCAMKCMWAQTRPWFMFSSERVLGNWSQNPCYLLGKNFVYRKNSPQRSIKPTTLHQGRQRAQHTTNELFWLPYSLSVAVICHLVLMRGNYRCQKHLISWAIVYIPKKKKKIIWLLCGIHAWNAELLCTLYSALGGRNSSLVVFGLAVHSVAGSILLWGNFPVEGIFPLELTWVQTPFPPKLFRMRV